ncbi:SPL family radical SAM protein [Paenibacillus hexagrammi]|uniref:Radical SAM protein n=1 Tax=Paenibacillus hexagrammi TaxID=2908839 RepID=A0ABY3SIY8_9BACL|nr:radical SAM protein [Paenibacillus sp. YPD9-1]UJF34004.1 radical SAM protein [Paenibacillus sp. YPD9-1]
MSVHYTKKKPKQLLNKASGFLEGYTHTLNPYTGCSFACSYCYVRQMPVNLFREGEWGSWVDAKEGASELLHKELEKARRKGAVTIFMSSSTDPYQPAEYKERITRSLLEVMVEHQPDFLFVQTRSPLVTRDIDLLARLGERVRVSVTVETDREDIRRAFSPYAPPIPARLNALRKLAECGIPAQAAVAPMLPSTSEFAARLAGVVDRVCIDDYFMGDGSKGRRTERIGIAAIYQQLGLEEWYSRDAYQRVYQDLLRYFPPEQVLVSQEGFLP